MERFQRVVHVVTLGMSLVAGREVGIQTVGRGRGFIDILWLRNYNLVQESEQSVFALDWVGPFPLCRHVQAQGYNS